MSLLTKELGSMWIFNAALMKSVRCISAVKPQNMVFALLWKTAQIH